MSTIEKAAARLRDLDETKPESADDSAPVSRHEGIGEARHFGAQGAKQAPIQMDWKALRRLGIYPPAHMEAQLQREFQRVKRPLVTNLREADAISSRTNVTPANVMLVSSAHPEEGKTYSAFNLALSLADELDYSVLLVDGDVARRDITKCLNLKDHVGLMDTLADTDIAPEDAIVDTEVSGLSVMPAGGKSQTAVEQMSSRRMESVVAELSDDPARIVLFDSSPMLATVEAQAIAYYASQLLLVVKAGATEQRAVEAAVSLIDTTRCSINLMLNQSVHRFGDDYESYYGMYYYGTDERG